MAIIPDLNTVTNQTGVKTTDNTATNIAIIHINPDTVVTVKAYVSARRTGGSSGTSGDSAGYEVFATFKDSSGSAVQVGSTNSVMNEDNVNLNVAWATSGSNALLQVTGDTGNNYTWGAITEATSTKF